MVYEKVPGRFARGYGLFRSQHQGAGYTVNGQIINCIDEVPCTRNISTLANQAHTMGEGEIGVTAKGGICNKRIGLIFKNKLECSAQL